VHRWIIARVLFLIIFVINVIFCIFKFVRITIIIPTPICGTVAEQVSHTVNRLRCKQTAAADRKGAADR
jgi:hypothetical protein